VKELVQVKLEACFATKIDAAGNKSNVLRLTAQPVQTFSTPSAEATHEAMGSASDGEGGSTGLYRIGKGVSPPVPRNSVEALFSDEARSKHIQGVVLVQVIVDANGMPQHPRVVRGIGYGLDEQALKAVMKYRFKPAMKEGSVPVPVMITVEVNFRLYERN
jgi:TonB family protein